MKSELNKEEILRNCVKLNTSGGQEAQTKARARRQNQQIVENKNQRNQQSLFLRLSSIKPVSR